MSVKITYYVHGTTTDNLSKLSTGWLPGELSEKGISQAKDLAKIVKDKHYDAIFSSDLKRAIDSAQINFAGKKFYIDKRLRKCNYGDLNGRPEHLVVYQNHITKPFLNGESLIDVQKRIQEFCTYIKQNFDNQHIAIVAHKAPQLALEVICNKKSWKTALETDWRNTKSWQPGWKYIFD